MRAHAAEHEIAERARHESLFGSSSTTSIDGSAEPHVLGGGGAAPPAADHDHATRELGLTSPLVVAQPATPPSAATPPSMPTLRNVVANHGSPVRPRRPPSAPRWGPRRLKPFIARQRPGIAVRSVPPPAVTTSSDQSMALNFGCPRSRSAAAPTPPSRDDHSTIAPAPAEQAGRKTAAPSFCESPALRERRAARARRRARSTRRPTQSFTWPSPARQSEPAPQPPASVIPTPKAQPARERADPGARKHPLALVLEVGELQDREAERRRRRAPARPPACARRRPS